MCLSIPGKIQEIDGLQAKVEVGGNVVDCSLALLEDEELAVGDYVLVHTGYALQKYQVEEAEELLAMLKEALHADTEVL